MLRQAVNVAKIGDQKYNTGVNDYDCVYSILIYVIYDYVENKPHVEIGVLRFGVSNGG